MGDVPLVRDDFCTVSSNAHHVWSNANNAIVEYPTLFWLPKCAEEKCEENILFSTWSSRRLDIQLQYDLKEFDLKAFHWLKLQAKSKTSPYK